MIEAIVDQLVKIRKKKNNVQAIERNKATITMLS